MSHSLLPHSRGLLFSLFFHPVHYFLHMLTTHLEHLHGEIYAELIVQWLARSGHNFPFVLNIQSKYPCLLPRSVSCGNKTFTPRASMPHALQSCAYIQLSLHIHSQNPRIQSTRPAELGFPRFCSRAEQSQRRHSLRRQVRQVPLRRDPPRMHRFAQRLCVERLVYRGRRKFNRRFILRRHTLIFFFFVLVVVPKIAHTDGSKEGWDPG